MPVAETEQGEARRKDGGGGRANDSRKIIEKLQLDGIKGCQGNY